MSALFIGLLTLSMAAEASESGDRIARAAAELAAQRIPYADRPLGGPDGPEQAGLPSAGLDCVTFIEAVLLRAGGVFQAPDQEAWLRKTRYQKGVVAYCNRAHYTTDWADQNSALGWLADMTAPIARDAGIGLQQHAWSRSWMGQHGLDPNRCLAAQGPAKGIVRYIPAVDYAKAAGRIIPGDILVFVANSPGLETAHVGIVEMSNRLAMESSAAGHSRVEGNWQTYAAALKNRFLGIRILRVSELPGS